MLDYNRIPAVDKRTFLFTSRDFWRHHRHLKVTSFHIAHAAPLSNTHQHSDWLNWKSTSKMWEENPTLTKDPFNIDRSGLARILVVRNNVWLKSHTWYSKIIQHHMMQARICYSTFIPPHTHIRDLFCICAEISVKLVTELRWQRRR